MIMSEKEILKEAIGRTLIPEYHQIIEDASDDHEFSPKFQKRMDKLIRRRRKPYYRFINTAGKRVAVIILAFLTISFTTVMSVEALRTPFLDFIMSIFSDHSEVRGIDDSGNYPEKIENYYEITYDLSEYKIERDERTEQEHILFYRKGDNMICYYQITVKEFQENYNTENADIENIDINGHDAIGFLDNNGYYTLMWNNGEYIINIGSNIGKNALIEVAKSVQKVEK